MKPWESITLPLFTDVIDFFNFIITFTIISYYLSYNLNESTVNFSMYEKGYTNWMGNKDSIVSKYGVRWFRIWEFFLAYSTIIARQGSATVYQIVAHKNLNSFERERFVSGICLLFIFCHPYCYNYHCAIIVIILIVNEYNTLVVDRPVVESRRCFSVTSFQICLIQSNRATKPLIKRYLKYQTLQFTNNVTRSRQLHTKPIIPV